MTVKDAVELAAVYLQLEDVLSTSSLYYNFGYRKLDVDRLYNKRCHP